MAGDGADAPAGPGGQERHCNRAGHRLNGGRWRGGARNGSGGNPTLSALSVERDGFKFHVLYTPAHDVLQLTVRSKEGFR